MDYLVKNSTTQYSILADEFNKTCCFAAEILQKYIFESSSVKLSITHTNKSMKAIHIGAKPFVSGDGRVRCLYTNNDIYLDGDGENGSLNATIEFLSRIIDLDILDINSVYFAKKSNIKLCKAFDYKPSFKYRFATYGWVRNDETTRLLMRLSLQDEVFITGNICHNSLQILKYNDSVIKDEFLNAQKNQLCYNNLQTRELFVKNLREILNKEYPSTCLKYFILGMEDNQDWCSCDLCKQKKPSDSMIEFANYVSRTINDERIANSKEPIKFILFAYYNTIVAPNISVDENVGVYFAPIKARFRENFDHKSNTQYLNNFNAWKAKTNTIFAWTYSFYTRRNFLFYDTFSSIKKLYSTLSKYNVLGMYDQTISYVENETGFAHLKAYIQYHLLWNKNEHVASLIKRYFKIEFGNYNREMMGIFKKTQKIFKKIYALERIDPKPWINEANADKYSEIGQCLDKFNCLKQTNINKKLKTFLTTTIFNMKTYIEESKNDISISNKIKLELLSYQYLYLLVFDRENDKDFLQLFEDMNSYHIYYVQEGKKVEKIDNLKL